MEKFIPYEKLSKKEKRKIDQAKRQTWGELNPVTRKPTNSKAYNRRKSQDWKRELPPTACDSSFLERYGLTVIRIPNNEVNTNFRSVCEYIDAAVKQSLSQLR